MFPKHLVVLALSTPLLVMPMSYDTAVATVAPRPQPAVRTATPARSAAVGAGMQNSAVPAPRTTLRSLFSDIRPDGSIPLAAALQAFSLLAGPLPGVKVPNGPDGRTMDGTFAVNWVLGHWDRLTPAQREAVKGFLTAGLTPRTVLAAPGDGAGHARLAAKVTTPPLGPYLAMLKADEVVIASNIGHPMGLPVSVVAETKQTKTYLAETVLYDKSGGFTGRAARCEVQLQPLLFTTDAETVSDTLMHEMFHCFQGADYPTLAQFNDAPTWLIEGSAQWVAQSLAPSAAQGDGWWDLYLEHPTIPLFSRSYDAIGFFAHMDETGTDPWHAFDKIFRAAPTSAQAYAMATDEEFKLTWASSFLRYRDYGEGWDTTGPDIPKISYIPKLYSLQNGSSISGKVAPYANLVLAVTTDANAIEVIVNT
ncbi:MAG TPA: hypothetical protein VME46_17500, partial [Acidimicrobiales bacterium]|nr:hypothetical protein [Acidimicrobiales bacterium]